MLKHAITIALFTAGLMMAPAQADFIPTDWKNAGDNLATLDTDTGLEWLDLTQTGGKSINDIKALLDTTYAGWRLPTYDEIVTMASTLFPVISNYPGQTLSGSYAGGDMASFNQFGQNSGNYTYGIYDKNGQTYFFGTDSANNVLYFDYYIDPSLNWKRSLEGVFLVSDGGTTLSSINNPTLNINNPNAPVNQVTPGEPTDVPAPAIGFAALLLGLAGAVRKRTARA